MFDFFGYQVNPESFRRRDIETSPDASQSGYTEGLTGYMFYVNITA